MRVMLILAFDTTSEYGGVSLHRDFECLASAESHGEPNYSVTLFQTVDRLLSETQLALPDVSLISVATGPGSFTGIRVGLAAAQGWAQAIGCPVCGVSALEAIVEQARPAADWAVAILDARRGEFYLSVVHRREAERAGADDVRPWGLVEVLDTEPPRGLRQGAGQPGWLLKRELVAPFLLRFARDRSGAGTVCCVGRDCDTASQALRATLGPAFNWETVAGPLTAAIARLALVAHREGRAQAPRQLDALYLRRSDAEMHWKED